MRIYNLLLRLFIILVTAACSGTSDVKIIISDNAGIIERLAAKEIRKYIYLRTNELPDIQVGYSKRIRGKAIVLSVDVLLEEQEFRLKTYSSLQDHVLRITGGSPQGLLYGAYEFAEQMGIRFYLHGDVIPDEKTSFRIPEMDIQKKPLFKTRGILPFHDFPEGPDWWNEDDYKAIIGQLPKLKMNFIGFHTYPWRTDFNGEGPKAEPLIWIGKEGDVHDDGTVKSAYPVLNFHTADSTWGYSPARTADFLSGASQLFETDYFGADYIKGISPWPHTEDENKMLFDETGRIFSSAFTFARTLGVKVCAGTETPLIFPESQRKRYGIKQETEKEVKETYRGIFSRIQKAYPIDYYWLWTPESWTWSGVEDRVVEKTIRDMQLAYDALHELGSPFTLATCGWVLGPPADRTTFDRVLPKDMPFSCINRGLGYTRVDKGFGSVTGRSKWSIPWMEDDPALLTAQLWAGRMRKDALDSWKYGCDGLFGIHWRTRGIGPTVSALARAAWECDGYQDIRTGRDLPVQDFYTDWVLSEFGLDDPALVKIFTELDSKGVESKEGYKGDAPLNASDWIQGPGALMVNREIDDIRERIFRYDFLPVMESIRSKVSGDGNLERFDYWMNALRFNKLVLEVTLAQVELNQIMEQIRTEPRTDIKTMMAKDEALPKRIELAHRWEAMNRILLSFVSTNGELGTIANLEMHNIRKNGNLTGHDELLKSILNEDLPGEADVPDTYSGRTRVIVTTLQSVMLQGEDFRLRIRVLDVGDRLSGKLYYRKLGGRKYSGVPMKPLSSHVFEVHIPASQLQDDFEYYIELESGREKVLFPATAGKINQTVVLL